MKKIALVIITLLFNGPFLFCQAHLVDVENKKYKTSTNIEILGQAGYMNVLENRNNPDSRKIKMKYIHLKSLSKNPVAPVVYLEGGGNSCTWQAESPEDLTDWIEILEVSDLIFVDQRGSDGDESLTYIWQEEYPKDFFISEEIAIDHYKLMSAKGLSTFQKKGVDIRGYTIEEHAQDIHELTQLLNIESYSIFGFSYGTHIGMTVMKLFPERIEKAILVGADAPNQSLNYPRYLDEHIGLINTLIQKDEVIKKQIPDLNKLVFKVMDKLDKNPAVVTIQNPLTGKNMDLPIGPFGLALILRLDIDDANDIPIIPRLLYSIDEGDHSLLTYFVQKRMVYAIGLPGNGINQQVASGVSKERWGIIQKEAKKSIFGNVVNFPFSAAIDPQYWVQNTLSFDSSIPLKTDIPTLFITGTLDCRTPVAQVEETMKGFSDVRHIRVVNAGHEQSLWNKETFDESIPDFLSGKEVKSIEHYYSDIAFIPLTGKAEGHPSLQ